MIRVAAVLLLSVLTTREQAALALIHFPWQQLKFQIVFMPPRPNLRAMTFPAERRIEVYERPHDDVQLVAYDIAHELGHAIDVTYNTEQTRSEWLKLRGIDRSTPWFGCSGCSDFATPAGDFAETFALILFGPKDFRGRIARAPDAKQMPALVSFFDKIVPLT